MAIRIINKDKIRNIYDYIAYFEQEKGDLNFFISTIFDGLYSYDEILELIYYYEKFNGLDDDIDIEEYEARYGDIPFEDQLERIKLIFKEVYYAMQSPKYKPNFKRKK